MDTSANKSEWSDASERWDVPAFQAYAAPFFSQGKGWTFTAGRRDITLKGPDVAWFDEALQTQNMGPARGSGVLVEEAGVWKIAQYNLSVPCPNSHRSLPKTVRAPNS